MQLSCWLTVPGLVGGSEQADLINGSERVRAHRSCAIEAWKALEVRQVDKSPRNLEKLRTSDRACPRSGQAARQEF